MEKSPLPSSPFPITPGGLQQSRIAIHALERQFRQTAKPAATRVPNLRKRLCPASPATIFRTASPKIAPRASAVGVRSWKARGSAGHLAETLDDLTATSPALSGLRAAMAAWRFERAPLDPTCARAVLAAGREAVAPELRALARHLAPRLGPPAEARNWPARRDGPDREAALATLDRGMADGAHGLFWRGKAFEYALTAGLPDLAERVAASLADDPATAPLAARLAAESAAAFAAPADALAAAQAVDATLFPRFAALAMAYAYSASNREQEATTTLLQLWRRENWHPGLTLRLDERLFPTPPARLEAWAGRLTVCVYSWNRAARLERTLASLAASRLGPARLLVLDNGSTDDTAAVCRAAAERFAPGRFHSLSLPTNIGRAGRPQLAGRPGRRPARVAGGLRGRRRDPAGKLVGGAGRNPGRRSRGGRGRGPHLCRRHRRARVRRRASAASPRRPERPPPGQLPARPGFRADRRQPVLPVGVGLLPSAARPGPSRRGAVRHPVFAQPVRRSGPGPSELSRRWPLPAVWRPGRGPPPAGTGQARRRPGPWAPGSNWTDCFRRQGWKSPPNGNLDTAWEELHAAWTRLVRFSRACTAADPPACR